MSFSKKDTAVVKGVAICFLILYHCFSSADRLCGYDVSLILPQKIAMYLCESMNICVGMFAFLSAYGLTKSYVSSEKKLAGTGHMDSYFVIKRVISLVGAFILPAVLCIIATFFICPDYKPYGKGAAFFLNIITDLLGFGGLVGSKNFIGTWWYISFAIVIIALVPLTVRLCKKFGLLVFVPYLVLPALFIKGFYSSSGLTNMTRWLLCIPVGVFFAQYNILDFLKSKTITQNKVIGKIIKFIILTALLVLLVRLRTCKWVKEYAFYIISTLLPVYFVYWLYEFFTDIPIVKNAFAFLGNHSANIFYMHTFIRSVWFCDLTYSLKYDGLIFLFVLAASVAMSYIVILIEKVTRYNKALAFVSEKCAETTRKFLCRAYTNFQ